MVMARVVYAIPGQEVQDPPPSAAEKFATQTAFIFHVHVQQV
jgi:hypothetical protein